MRNRVVDISRASAAVDRAQRAVDQAASERAYDDANVASLAREVTELDAQVTALAKSMPQPPTSSNRPAPERKALAWATTASTTCATKAPSSDEQGKGNTIRPRCND